MTATIEISVSFGSANCGQKSHQILGWFWGSQLFLGNRILQRKKLESLRSRGGTWRQFSHVVDVDFVLLRRFRMNFEDVERFRHHPGSVQSTRQRMVRIRIDPWSKDSRSYRASRWVGLENPWLGSIFSRRQPTAFHRRSACLGWEVSIRGAPPDKKSRKDRVTLFHMKPSFWRWFIQYTYTFCLDFVVKISWFLETPIRHI